MGLGQLLTLKGAPLAALLVYNKILETIGKSDLRDGAWGPLKAVGWNARRNAAQCALIVAHKKLHFDKGGSSSDDRKNVVNSDAIDEGRMWAKHQLPYTLGQLEIVLQPLQRDEDRAEIISMIDVARDMLVQANL